MSEADLGVRVFLIDAFSSPMGLLELGLASLLPLLMSLSDESARLGQVWLDAVANNMPQAAADAAAQLDALAAAMLGLEVIAGSAIDFALFFAGFSTANSDASALQTSLAQLQISVQGASQNLGDMTNYLFQVSSASIYTADQVTQGFSLLGEKGYTADQIMQGMGQTMVYLSESIGTPNSGTVGAANLLATAMELFQAKASQAGHYADLLTYAFYNGIPNVDGLRSALEQVGGRAQMIGIPFDQLVVALDQLGRAGMTGQQAGAALNYTLQALYAPIIKTQNELEYLGIITAGHVTPAFQLFTNQLDAAARAAGTTAPQYDGTINSLDQLFKLGQSLKVIPIDATFYQWAIRLGILNNAFYDSKGNAKDLITNLQTLADKIKGLPQEQQIAAFQQLFNVRSGQGVTALIDNLSKVQAKYDALKNSNDANGLAAKDAALRTDTLAAAQQQLSTTFTDFMAKAGMPVANFFKGLLQNLNGLLSGITTGKTDFAGFFGTFLTVGTIISPIGILVGLILLLTSGFTLFGVALAPIIGTIALIAGGIALAALAIAGLITWVKSSPPVLAFFQQLGSIIGGAFMGALKQIGSAFQTAFQQVVQALQPALPALKLLGGLLLLIFSSAVVGAIIAVINLIAGFLSGLATAIGGVIQIIMGIIAFVKGFIQIFIGLFTGNQAMINNGAQQMLGGLGNIFKGVFNVILGVLQGTLGAIAQAILGAFQGMFGVIGNVMNMIPNSIAKGFGQALTSISNFIGQAIAWFAGLPGQAIKWFSDLVNGIVNWFLNLFNTLVGHSIIPDLVNGIFTWFLKLLGLPAQLFTGFIQAIISGASALGGVFMTYVVNPIMNVMNGLINGALNWGKNLIQMFINGIQSMIGGIGNIFSGIGTTIHNFLGFGSPTKEGPGSTSHTWMPNLMNMLITGVHAGTPGLRAAAMGAATALHQGFTSPTIQGLQAGAASSFAQGGNTTIPLVVDGNTLAQVVLNRATGQLKMSGQGRMMR